MSAGLIRNQRLEFDENDEQGKQNERFDQRQTENHNRLDTTCRARIASRAFDRAGANFSLTESAAQNRDAETDAGGDGFVADLSRSVIRAGCASRTRLGESNEVHQNHC